MSAHATTPGKCARCEAPRYADEETCRYCGGGEPVDTAPILVAVLALAMVSILALAVLAR